MKVVTLLLLAYPHFHFFFFFFPPHLKEHLAGQISHEDEDVKKDVSTWLRAQAA